MDTDRGTGIERRLAQLEESQERLWSRRDDLELLIAMLEDMPALKPDAAARLEVYRQTFERLTYECRKLAWQIAELRSQAAA